MTTDKISKMDAKEVYEELLAKNKKNDKQINSELGYLVTNIVSFATLCGVAAYTMMFQLSPQIIPVDDKGSHFESVPLNLPTMDGKALKQWYTDALTEMFDFNYRELETHSSKVGYLFNDEGLREFDKYINTSMFAKTVKARHGIVDIIIDKAVNISEGALSDRMAWQMSTNAALMIYINGKPLRVGVFTITAIAYREDQNISPSGIVIKNITLREVGK